MTISTYSPPKLLSPRKWDGLRVGLFGGSFNPPHDGHAHVALTALQSLQLDYVWWLVSPQNPLKKDPPPPTQQRMAACRAMLTHPRMIVSDLEDQMGTRLTVDTVMGIRKNFPKTDFIWLSGMDIAHDLHHWGNWQALLQLIPFAHLTRPPADSLIKNCPLKLYQRQKHITLHKGGCWPLTPGYTYWMMDKRMLDISSTKLRNDN